MQQDRGSLWMPSGAPGGSASSRSLLVHRLLALTASQSPHLGRHRHRIHGNAHGLGSNRCAMRSDRSGQRRVRALPCSGARSASAGSRATPRRLARARRRKRCRVSRAWAPHVRALQRRTHAERGGGVHHVQVVFQSVAGPQMQQKETRDGVRVLNPSSQNASLDPELAPHVAIPCVRRNGGSPVSIWCDYAQPWVTLSESMQRVPHNSSLGASGAEPSGGRSASAGME